MNKVLRDNLTRFWIFLYLHPVRGRGSPTPVINMEEIIRPREEGAVVDLWR